MFCYLVECEFELQFNSLIYNEQWHLVGGFITEESANNKVAEYKLLYPNLKFKVTKIQIYF